MIYDAIVVGAGPGGSAAAIRLAERGWNVLLLEKHTFPRDKICGDLISPRSIRTLEQLGCLPAVQAAAANRLRSGTLYVNGREIASAAIPDVAGLHNYGYGLPRLVFDEIIFRRAQARGAHSVEGCAVQGVVVEPDGVSVQAVCGRRPRRFRGRLVIGADGSHSVVARSLGLERRDSRNVIVALRAYYGELQGDPETVALFFDQRFFPGYGWIFQLGNGRANVGLGMVRDVYQRYQINLLRRLREWVEMDPHARLWLRGARLDGRVVGWPLNTYASGGATFAERALLIGDAGSFVDPINGEGIHTALETAVIAAGVAEEALQTGDLSAAFLASYERRWRAALALDLQMASLIVAIIQNRPLTPLWMTLLRLIGTAAGRDPRYAALCGGILAGVVPTHHSASPVAAAKTLRHGPALWSAELGHAAGPGLAGLTGAGMLAASHLLDAMSGMLAEPAHTAGWGLDVARKGAGVVRGLGEKYASSALQFVAGAGRPPALPWQILEETNDGHTQDIASPAG
ncbi:MAG: NAD(P)/FAD-dependent oxidoreductase [Candidatus Promineifilaceae bacterium]